MTGDKGEVGGCSEGREDGCFGTKMINFRNWENGNDRWRVHFNVSSLEPTRMRWENDQVCGVSESWSSARNNSVTSGTDVQDWKHKDCGWYCWHPSSASTSFSDWRPPSNISIRRTRHVWLKRGLVPLKADGHCFAVPLSTLKNCLLSVDTSLYPWHMSRENEGVVHEPTVPTGINRVTVHELSNQLPKWRCGELLSRTRLARGFIPWLTARIHGVRPFVRNLGRFQRSLTKGFNRIRHLRDGDSHTLGKCCTRPVELHNATSSAMLALPIEVVRGRLEHSEAKLRCVLPHLSCHIVLPSQLIGNTASVCVETRLPTPSPWFEWFSQATFLPNSKARGVDGRALRLRKHHIAVFDTGHGAESSWQEPTQSDLWELAMRQTSVACRWSRFQPEARHVALTESHEDRTSQANCCAQSSHAPLWRPGWEHTAGCQRTSWHVCPEKQRRWNKNEKNSETTMMTKK